MYVYRRSAGGNRTIIVRGFLNAREESGGEEEKRRERGVEWGVGEDTVHGVVVVVGRCEKKNCTNKLYCTERGKKNQICNAHDLIFSSGLRDFSLFFVRFRCFFIASSHDGT